MKKSPKKYELSTRSPTLSNTKKIKDSKVELLAPAGSFPSLIAAVHAGADAVYFGLREGPNMRAGAKNFLISDLPKMKKICSAGERGRVKMYLTMNTIVYDNELGKIEKIIKKVKPFVDAIICWDLSVMNLCKKYKIPFHVSTQASISNKEAAKFYKKLGAERVVLARELNLKQIKEISRVIPVECFCHGAMCVSVSGRCFTSQFLFKKSANRGECLQPCRRAYIIKDEEGNEVKLDRETVMSAKDLCTLPFIEEMKKAGIVSFKIEGRNREPEYVDTVTRVYRKALDKKLSENEIKEGLGELKKVYTKGFSSGFFLGVPTSDDFSNEQHSSSTQRKEYIGEIIHCFPEKQVGVVRIASGKIKVGDDILVIGDKTGLIRHRIERLEINKVSVSEAKKGDEVGIRIPGIKKRDKIYLVVRKD